MKTLGKVLPTESTTNRSTQDSLSALLQDSKSSTSLYHPGEKGEKSLRFRQTTYIPATSRNTNREQLRSTINAWGADKNNLKNNVSPINGFKLKRKLTIPDSFNYSLTQPQQDTVQQKSEVVPKKLEKRISNIEVKNDLVVKQTKVPKFLEKKISDQIAKTQARTELTPNATKTGVTPPKHFAQLTKKHVNMSVVSSPAPHLKLKHKVSLPCNLTSEEVLGLKKELGMENKSWMAQFRKIKHIGQGRFGQVFLVQHILTNSVFALKQIKKESVIKNKIQEQFLMEIKLQSFFNHPNILKLYGFFSDEENIYLILEYMEEGTLYQNLKQNSSLGQKEASRKLHEILLGLNYMHSLNIAHRDIKPENIVISHNVCKICDFGWAAQCEDRRRTICGTIDYAPPQILSGQQYGIEIDLWCVGVLCYQLLVGKCPFYHVSRHETMKKIINSSKQVLNLPPSLSGESRDFIQKLIVKNPEQRMTTQCALKHPLITKYDEGL